MSAIVTDQFRINNAGNFLGDVNNSENSYYVFVGLSNPSAAVRSSVAFGRNANDTEWNSDTTRKKPIDNFNYSNHVKDTMIFGKKITSDNVRRVIRKVTWTKETRYDMYRHDYSESNLFKWLIKKSFNLNNLYHEDIIKPIYIDNVHNV